MEQNQSRPAPPPRLLLAVAGTAVVTYLAAHALEAPIVGLVAKPVPALALALWVITGGRGVLARAVATGLVFSAIGDVLLDLQGHFVAGLLAFLGAHLAFVAGFTADVRRLAPLRALPFLAYASGMLLFLRPGLGAMLLPVGFYALAFSSDMWRAAARVGAHGPATRQEWWVLLGTLSFAASDSLIALDRFHATIARVRIPIIGLYWLGLLGIAAGVALSRKWSGIHSLAPLAAAATVTGSAQRQRPPRRHR